MIREVAKREIESLDYYLQNHTDDYSEESHTAMMMAIKALEQESKWIPFIKRPMTEDEELLYESCYGDAVILDCPLPEDGQEVLVSSGGYVCVDTFCIDDGCYFEGVEIDDVDAWMPLPAPYGSQESEVTE